MTTYRLATRPNFGRLAEADEATPETSTQASTDPERPLLLDIPAAAEFAGIKERAMRHLFTQRVFPVVALGTRLYVRRGDLLAYFDRHTQPARSMPRGR